VNVLRVERCARSRRVPQQAKSSIRAYVIRVTNSDSQPAKRVLCCAATSKVRSLSFCHLVDEAMHTFTLLLILRMLP